ncbi:hypothetical protein ElyMa_005294100 [Elysia marginata]|uniref:CUB domain-containing protein n=1 Tax=Elysia marginata TaxID=1093978 RepID=A0AAV4K273_9GAST|nr:hypothetical protein ElyMa_005294100 [Elysia marginata]
MLSNCLLKLTVLHALLWTSVYGTMLPMWKNLLTHHQHWVGRYFLTQDDSVYYDCSLSVVSLGQTESKSYVVVTADHIDIDMKVYSTDDDTVVYLEEEAVWRKTKYFENHTDIKITGEFVSDHLYYKFYANVSSAEEDNFATMALRPRGSPLKNPYRKQNHLNYGVVYGVPLSCAAILMASGIAILFWAARKGYLRSLAWSYKSFNNAPENSQPPLEMRGPDDKTASVA